VTPAQRSALRGPVIALAKRAGDAIMQVYASDFAVEHKDDRSPLTAADMAAHHCIVDGLSALTPELPILSEESASVPYAVRRAWQRYWLVDPLDGTREFVKRNGEFTVNIALIEDGRATLGVIFAPARDYLAHAVLGEDAIVDDGRGARTVRASTQLPARWRVAGSRSHGDGRLDGFLDRLGPHDLVPLGSSLKFCLVAEGAADVYLRLGPTSEWDTAAGQCIVEAAGGQVTDLRLAPLQYNQRDSLLNPEFLVHAGTVTDWAPLLAPFLR
jgi:3'(2'), 5'-bisphosphate nucleotidase